MIVLLLPPQPIFCKLHESKAEFLSLLETNTISFSQRTPMVFVAWHLKCSDDKLSVSPWVSLQTLWRVLFPLRMLKVDGNAIWDDHIERDRMDARVWDSRILWYNMNLCQHLKLSACLIYMPSGKRSNDTGMKQWEFIFQETIILDYYEIEIEFEKHLGKMLRSHEVEGQIWRSRDQKQPRFARRP